MGLSRGWKKMYCALLPFCPHVGEVVSELQLLFIDEQALTLVDKVWVTESRSEACPTRARLHVDLVSYAAVYAVLFQPIRSVHLKFATQSVEEEEE